MAEISFKTIDFKIDSNTLNRDSTRSMKDYIDNKADKLKKLAKAKVGVRSGRLRRSITVLEKVNVAGKVYQVAVGSRVSYAAAHHNGTRAYRISSKRNKVMRFKGGSVIAIGRTDGSGNVYARSVNHPRVAANRYLTGPAKTIMTSRK
jgi:hypothetical protein